MSTKPSTLFSEADALKEMDEKEEDLGALIYREIQLRKKEAAAAKATSTANADWIGPRREREAHLLLQLIELQLPLVKPPLSTKIRLLTI
jgi:hypothetical protein